MPGRLFSRSVMQDIFNRSREMRLLSDTYCTVLAGFEPPTTLELSLPEVRAPAQYLIDGGLQPALAQRLSSTYMDFVARHREIFESHFYRATHGGCHLPIEYYRNTFIALFKRTIKAWDSQFVSIVRVQLYRVGVSSASVRPGCVDASTIVISKTLTMLNHYYTDTRKRRSESRNYCETRT
jgi:hypothetical protein